MGRAQDVPLDRPGGRLPLTAVGGGEHDVRLVERRGSTGPGEHADHGVGTDPMERDATLGTGLDRGEVGEHRAALQGEERGPDEVIRIG